MLLKFVVILCLAMAIGFSKASIIRQVQDGSKRIQNLDDEGKVVMSWEVDDVTGIVTFEVEAETTGYIGFGISPQGGMIGADIFIAGVNPDGSVYSSDRHALIESTPVVDDHSDWELLDAQEFEGISRKITYIKMSRKINTCDSQDYPISNDTNRLIYAIGETDQIAYHQSWRGTRSIHLLGAAMPELDTDNSVWDYIVDTTMPPLDTVYWCTFHKGPELTKKHHVIGFEAHLPDANSLRFTHHTTIYNCHVPAGSNQTPEELFGNFTYDKFEGELCYKNFQEGEVIPPIRYCQEFLFVWAKGGMEMALPADVGYPIGPESESPVAPMTQFYMFEVHYDNPEKLENVKFETGVKMYYSETLRPIEAGMLKFAHYTNPSLTIPPNVKNYIVSGHCSPSCTQHFPTGGITVFNSMLHAHLSGRSIKLRHFRDSQELPWLDSDEHYDFDYQQNKQLSEPRQILPGDQLTIECAFNTMWKKGEVVIGGLSTQDEMCQIFTWYYPRMDVAMCSSSYPIESGVANFGITKFEELPSTTGVKSSLMILEPENLAGEYEETLNLRFGNWSTPFKQEMEMKRRFEEHDTVCLNIRTGEQLTQGVMAKYPEGFEPYLPVDVCVSGGPAPPAKDNGGVEIKMSEIIIFLCVGYVVSL